MTWGMHLYWPPSAEVLTAPASDRLAMHSPVNTVPQAPSFPRLASCPVRAPERVVHTE